MIGSVVTVLPLLLTVCLSGSLAFKEDPEVHYDALQLILSKNYSGEAHWVVTDDGYILGMQRIPGPRGSKPDPNRPVFFLQHGLIASSANWLTNLANESLAYLLADAGFDVWLGNIRGNTYSRNHTTLKPSQKEFWNFTFDEHASKDLPAMVNYVLTITGQTELFYVGHSQGTVMGFAGFTINQTLAKQIKTFFALAPVTTVKYIQGLFRLLSEKYISESIVWFFDTFGTGEFFPNYEIIKMLSKDFCTPAMQVTDGVCEDILFLICGFDQTDVNISSNNPANYFVLHPQTRIPVYYSHTPAGTSVKNCIHFSQEVNSGRFAMYDYGEALNMIEYGTPNPPAYNMSELNIPTALFTGGQDWLADPTDVNSSIPLLNTTGKVFYRKHIPKYDHLDFIWGMDSAALIYADVISIAKSLLNV